MTDNNDFIQRNNSDTPEHWQQVAVRYATVWKPPTDVVKTDRVLTILVEVAGVREKDIDVVLHDRQLTISGTRQPLAAKDAAFYRMEIQRGAFRLEVKIPWPVQRDAITATYHDGMLKVILPLVPVRNIPIGDVQEDI